MIYWLSKEVSDLIEDSAVPIRLMVCSGSPEGHIELSCEFGDLEPHIDLGDCTGLTDAEINARFVKEFAKVAERYLKRSDLLWHIADYLDTFAKAMLDTL